jgi:cyanophycin synthetase
MPGLAQHGCSYGEPGGFVRRLQEGTWLGHVVEHVALELQCLAGADVTRGKTRSEPGRRGIYNVLYTYHDETVGLLAGRFALQLVASLLPAEFRHIEGLEIVSDGHEAPDGAHLASAVEYLCQAVRRSAFGPTTASIVREARRRSIPIMRLDEDSSLVQLGFGKNQRRIRASVTGLTSEIGTEIAGDKDLTKSLLRAAGIPVPEGGLAGDPEDAVRLAESLGYPVVAKPLDGNHGRGITVGLSTPEDVRSGFAAAREHARKVLIEKQFVGSDHRILVVAGEVVAVAERVPAHVVGDGQSTISELVDRTNLDPRRGIGHECVLTRIEIDDCVRNYLARAQLTPSSIPQPGQIVFLRPTANMSTGGTAIDRTDVIHPENALMARRAALTVGLDVAGIDFIAPDITRPVSQTGGGVIEVNAGPGFRMHLQPSVGRARNVARPVLDLLYPPGSPSRIPIFAVTGTNGKSTTVRMLAHVLRQAGATVGYTTTTGIYVDGQRILRADASGPGSARAILRDPTVDVAVLETARGGILREGLGFDQCDVGAVLNVKEDHLGLNGIDTLDQLAAVKSVVVESVRRGGWSILNADDPLTLGMERRAGGQVVLFSMRGREMPRALKAHLAGGGVAVVLERDDARSEIVIRDGGESIALMDPAEIPATIDGMADFNIQNALATITMAYAHGVSPKTIRLALSTFENSFEHSPGRLNFCDKAGFRVLLDYAHNPDGITAMAGLIKKLRHRYRRVVGCVGIAGDRRDCDIREVGAISAPLFDEIILREDDDLRGRRPGEVAALLAEGAEAAGGPGRQIRTVLSEREAIAASLQAARPGDLLVLIADDVERAWSDVLQFDPQQDLPISAVPDGNGPDARGAG